MKRLAMLVVTVLCLVLILALMKEDQPVSFVSVRVLAQKEGYFIREFPGNSQGFYVSKHELPKGNFVLNKNKIDDAWKGIVWVNVIDGTFVIDLSATIWGDCFAVGDPDLIEELQKINETRRCRPF